MKHKGIRKIYLLSLIFLLCCASVIYAGCYLFLHKKSVLQDKILISADKKIVAINDIRKTAVSQDASGNVVVKSTADYDVLFFDYAQEKSFLITLTNPTADVDTARNEAEDDFLKILGVNKKQACLLKVSLTVPISVNERLAGIDYGLSFCSNGKPF